MKQFKPLGRRREFILEWIAKNEKATNRDILKEVAGRFDHSSRVTIARDLEILVRRKFLKRFGRGRGIYYIAEEKSLLRPIDIERYFERKDDEREIKTPRIDFSKIEVWNSLLDTSELEKIEAWTKNYQKSFASYSPSQIHKELERITIEFSWKSSRIEGNTYTLLDTERLIKDLVEAPHKSHEEAVMILNHKKALEFIWAHPQDYKKLSIRKIEEIHHLMVDGLKIRKGLRKKPVGIIGTRYRPHDNVYQIREALENLCNLVNKLRTPFLKALVTVAGISYIQPFEDGNKRTSRMMGNALLLAYRQCLLSYRSVDEVEYKKAMILFYEQHNLMNFKKIFLDQYNSATQNYFL